MPQEKGTSVVPSVTTEKASSFTGPREVPGGETDMQPCGVDEPATISNSSDVGRLSEASGSAATVKAVQVAPSVGKADQASGQTQSIRHSVVESKSTVGSAGM